ncbi:hypothetical protein RTP6_005471 [Batrachochytrium dendrobatidis]
MSCFHSEAILVAIRILIASMTFSLTHGQWIQTVTVPRCNNGSYIFPATSMMAENILPANIIGADPTCLVITPNLTAFNQFTTTGSISYMQCASSNCLPSTCISVSEIHDIATTPSPECGTYFHTLTMSKTLSPAALDATNTKSGVASFASALYASADISLDKPGFAGCQGSPSAGLVHYLFESCTQANATYWIKTVFTPIGQQTFTYNFCTSAGCDSGCFNVGRISKPAPPNRLSCVTGKHADIITTSATPLKDTSEYMRSNPSNIWPYSEINTTEPIDPSNPPMIYDGNATNLGKPDGLASNASSLSITVVSGIVIGCVLFICACATVAIVYIRRNKTGHANRDNPLKRQPKSIHPPTQLYESTRRYRNKSKNFLAIGRSKTLASFQTPRSAASPVALQHLSNAPLQSKTSYTNDAFYTNPSLPSNPAYSDSNALPSRLEKSPFRPSSIASSHLSPDLYTTPLTEPLPQLKPYQRNTDYVIPSTNTSQLSDGSSAAYGPVLHNSMYSYLTSPSSPPDLKPTLPHPVRGYLQSSQSGHIKPTLYDECIDYSEGTMSEF